MRFDDFVQRPLPKLIERVKVNLRTQDVQIFEYGGEFEATYLYFKSRFLNEKSPLYAEQAAFDEQIKIIDSLDFSSHGPSVKEFEKALKERRLKVMGFRLEPDHRVPKLDELCGRYLTYRQLIECGETQRRLSVPNLPKARETYSALLELATNILDPAIEYFGSIELTYGFARRNWQSTSNGEWRRVWINMPRTKLSKVCCRI